MLFADFPPVSRELDRVIQADRIPASPLGILGVNPDGNLPGFIGRSCGGIFWLPFIGAARSGLRIFPDSHCNLIGVFVFIYL